MATELATLPLDTVNKTLQYLSTRPYAEIAELIQEIQGNAQIVEAPEAEEESDAK